MNSSNQVMQDYLNAPTRPSRRASSAASVESPSTFNARIALKQKLKRELLLVETTNTIFYIY